MTILTNRMKEEHKEFIEIINSLKTIEKEDYGEALRKIINIKSKVVNHFYTEEFMVSIALDKGADDKNVIPILDTLRNQHKKIVSRINIMKNMIINNNKISDAKELALMIERHKNMEERLLYPKLDKIIPEKEKIYIMQNI